MSEQATSLHARMDAPHSSYRPDQLGPEPERELRTVSRMWLGCGYRPGVAAYLNFFLLADFLRTHDDAHPSRFATFRSMAASFQRTDRFVRAVTDSGPERTAGIGAPEVRRLLEAIRERHRALSIPGWMMTYFGYSLVENVERECTALDDAHRRLHLAYMCRAFRMMGVAFSTDRELMESFARCVEEEHAGLSPQLERRARHILLLGEMVGVSSRPGAIDMMLPAATRGVFAGIAGRVRPGTFRRGTARAVGRLLVKRAVGGRRG